MATKDRVADLDEAEIEVQQPDADTAQVPTPHQPGAERVATEEDEGAATPSSLGFTPKHREIEVESLAPVAAAPDQSGLVEIRMAYTIEEFTYGNPHRAWLLEEGKRYRIPVDMARYLHGIGAVAFR